jgi:hypothetical protein
MYIDAGAGSLLIQVLSAGVIAFAATLGSAPSRLRQIVRKLRGRRWSG